MEVIPTLLIILVAAFIAGALAHRLGQPVLLGFVLAGVALGPYTGGITVTELIDAQLLSEVGVGLLLLALGVEFSLATVRSESSVALLGAPLQMALTLLYGFAVGRLLGWDVSASFWFAALITLSSPIVALHTSGALHLGKTTTARIGRAILIVQNLAVVTLLFLVRRLQTGITELPSLVLALAEGIVLLAVLLLLGNYVLPGIYAYIARQERRELPLLVVVASAALVIYGTYLYGITFVEVAFAIGLLLSQSELGSRTLNALKSMRDLFGVLFFVSAGMLLDLSFLSANIVLVLGLVALVAIGKIAIVGGTTRIFGYRGQDAMMVALTLFGVSELSFVLARLALNSGVIDDDLHSLVVAVGLITMLLVPVLARLALRWPPEAGEQALHPSK
jgi:CPA2 family monovalent cation:H+ antiporter-2